MTKQKSMIKKLILRLTYKIWHPQVDKILNHEKEIGVISNTQLCHISSKFDKTQIHYLMEKDF